MNIVFEGINGTGKTTIIKALGKMMKQNRKDVHCISEIDNRSPLSDVLRKMYNKDKFLRLSENTSTILTESLILAADYHYMREYTKNIRGYKIYDRDIFTQIVYQKYFIAKEFGKNNEFFPYWEKCLLFEKKDIDVVIYVEAPLELCIERTCKRDNVEFSQEDRNILIDLYNLQKEYVVSYCKSNDIELLYIDGSKEIELNVKKIYQYLVELNREDNNGK